MHPRNLEYGSGTRRRLIRLQRSTGRFSIAILIGVLLGLLPNLIQAQSPTAKQRQSVKRIKSSIDRGGRQFASKKYDSSRELIEQAIEIVDELTVDASPELIELIQPEYDRLKKAHGLLIEAGQTLNELKPLPQPTIAGAISFKSAVAPILVAKCGTCHVSRNRGDFSAATFEALDQSTTIAYGMPAESRLIEVIENGEMPKGGLKVTPEELQTLRAWIQQGAKFDGENSKQSIAEFVDGAAAAPAQTPPMDIKLPTGNETVSFGTDIAPILIDNCARCHLVNNPRGNFSMANFRRLLAGGDGGTPIDPGDSSGSNLIKRLRGDGVDVMPPNGKLDDAVIQKIATWIDEGAAFDGGDERMAIRTVAATVKANSQTHEQLANARTALATETWKLVMGDVESVTVPSDNFLVTGSTNESRLTDVSLLVEKLAPKIATALRADSKQPLVKGNVSIFVIDKRYDFSEFGKMVEQRDFPKHISGHWGYTTVDAYVAILMTRNQTPEDIQAALVQQIAAIHVASLGPDIPRWFADGQGLWTAMKVVSRDENLKSLDADAAAIAAQMKRSDDFIRNQMPSDQAALVSYLFIKRLRSQSPNHAQLMKRLLNGEAFEPSFQAAFGGSPGQLLGQSPGRNRR